MDASEYLTIKQKLIDSGYSDEIDWSENVAAPETPMQFFIQYGWVVVNSGMKNQVAEKIWDRITEALAEGKSSSAVFGHKGKTEAIDYVFNHRDTIFREYQEASDKLAYFESLPWIGKITKWHLAKNVGMDVCKPDRHLVRIATRYNTDPDKLCRRLSEETGDRIVTVDMVLWRAANLGRI